MDTHAQQQQPIYYTNDPSHYQQIPQGYQQTQYHHPGCGQVPPPGFQQPHVYYQQQQQPVLVTEYSTRMGNDAQTAWILLLVGWFSGGCLCWIPGAIIGLRSQQPEAKTPGIINAVLSVIGGIVLIALIIYFSIFFTALYN